MFCHIPHQPFPLDPYRLHVTPRVFKSSSLRVLQPSFMPTVWESCCSVISVIYYCLVQYLLVCSLLCLFFKILRDFPSFWVPSPSPRLSLLYFYFLYFSQFMFLVCFGFSGFDFLPLFLPTMFLDCPSCFGFPCRTLFFYFTSSLPETLINSTCPHLCLLLDPLPIPHPKSS